MVQILSFLTGRPQYLLSASLQNVLERMSSVCTLLDDVTKVLKCPANILSWENIGHSTEIKPALSRAFGSYCIKLQVYLKEILCTRGI